MDSSPPESLTALVNDFLSKWGTFSIRSASKNVNDLSKSENCNVSHPSPSDTIRAVSNSSTGWNDPALWTDSRVPLVFHANKTLNTVSGEPMFCLVRKRARTCWRGPRLLPGKIPTTKNLRPKKPSLWCSPFLHPMQQALVILLIDRVLGVKHLGRTVFLRSTSPAAFLRHSLSWA